MNARDRGEERAMLDRLFGYDSSYLVFGNFTFLWIECFVLLAFVLGHRFREEAWRSPVPMIVLPFFVLQYLLALLILGLAERMRFVELLFVICAYSVYLFIFICEWLIRGGITVTPYSSPMSSNPAPARCLAGRRRFLWMCVTSKFHRCHCTDSMLGRAAIDRMSTVPRWTAARKV
jgi:hypothetical protein